MAAHPLCGFSGGFLLVIDKASSRFLAVQSLHVANAGVRNMLRRRPLLAHKKSRAKWKQPA
jgi:hypothetical protein